MPLTLSAASHAHHFQPAPDSKFFADDRGLVLWAGHLLHKYQPRKTTHHRCIWCNRKVAPFSDPGGIPRAFLRTKVRPEKEKRPSSAKATRQDPKTSWRRPGGNGTWQNVAQHSPPPLHTPPLVNTPKCCTKSLERLAVHDARSVLSEFGASYPHVLVKVQCGRQRTERRTWFFKIRRPMVVRCERCGRARVHGCVSV